MSDHLIVGTRKGLLQFEYDGKSSENGGWRFVRESFRAVPVSYASVDPRSGTLWACLDHGHWGPKLHRSKDQGVTWEEVEGPKFPENIMYSEDKVAAVSYLWFLKPGGVDQPGRLYLGTEPGGLFVSDDGGDSFALMDTLWNIPERTQWWFGGGRDHPGLCSIVVDPRDSRHITIGVSVGGVYESCDGGETWTARNTGLKACYLPDPASPFGHDPHFMLSSPSNPDVLWQQNHCGIFRSTDGGQNWQDISQPGGPAYFGFALAVDKNDDNVAWVVPAIDAEFRMAVDRALCVCRTDDGGKTWKAFREGLPQQATFDVVFRHALDISGNRLAFGTTTGNAYVSDNRGESWACLGHNLPPVYSVQFWQ